MGRGGGLLVVTLETIRGGAATRRQWQQHTLNFARMIALPQRSVRQFIRKVIDSIAKPLSGRKGAKPKAAKSKPKAQSRQVHG